MDYTPELAVGIVGLSGFQLIQAWNANAPKLADMRKADPNDKEMHQQLKDADILVGGMALILGSAFAVMTKRGLPLVLMMTIFGSVSFWYHNVLNGESVGSLIARDDA